MVRPFLFFFFLMSSLPVAACGARSAEDAERSMREFQNAAQWYGDEGNVPQALIHLDRALELDDRNARAYMLRGLIWYGRGELGKAESDARKAVEIVQETSAQSLFPEAANLLGGVLLERGDSEEAVRWFEASAADPLNTAPHTALGNLGWARFQAGDAPGAVDALEAAVSRQPRFCLGYLRLGEVHFAEGRFDEAEAAFTFALEADPSCDVLQEAWKQRGEARARLGHREDALRDFERCVELGRQTDAGAACAAFLEEAP
ncbi:MAG TPA: tetratricopeptide repeat protein [Polyangiaceae bacterium LLY-WYZ-14_1]|nr:tetratricopeptide repeat protein [Polyangiaceae bacterium LLY-WYZ-14_1]